MSCASSLWPRCHRLSSSAGFLLGGGQHFFQRHHGGVAALGKLAVFVVHVGHAAAHAGRKVAPGLAQHRHGAAGHVFAAVVAGALDHRGGARQAHRKALAGHAAEEGLAGGGAVHHGVADDGVADGVAAEVDAGAHHDAAADRPLPV